MSKRYSELENEIRINKFLKKSRENTLNGDEQRRYDQILLEEDKLIDKATYPYKMGGSFFIELEEPIKVPGTDEKAWIITIVGKDKINYIMYGGCSPNRLLNKEGSYWETEDDNDLWRSTRGYLTRAEAQKAINDFGIKGEVQMRGGCTCCGNFYEDPIDGLCKHYTYIEYLDENSNEDKIAFINYMKYLHRSPLKEDVEYLEILLSEFNKKCNYNLKLEDLDDDNLIKRLFS